MLKNLNFVLYESHYDKSDDIYYKDSVLNSLKKILNYESYLQNEDSEISVPSYLHVKITDLEDKQTTYYGSDRIKMSANLNSNLKQLAIVLLKTLKNTNLDNYKIFIKETASMINSEKFSVRGLKIFTFSLCGSDRNSDSDCLYYGYHNFYKEFDNKNSAYYYDKKLVFNIINSSNLSVSDKKTILDYIIDSNTIGYVIDDLNKIKSKELSEYFLNLNKKKIKEVGYNTIAYNGLIKTNPQNSNILSEKQIKSCRSVESLNKLIREFDDDELPEIIKKIDKIWFMPKKLISSYYNNWFVETSEYLDEDITERLIEIYLPENISSSLSENPLLASLANMLFTYTCDYAVNGFIKLIAFVNALDETQYNLCEPLIKCWLDHFFTSTMDFERSMGYGLADQIFNSNVEEKFRNMFITSIGENWNIKTLKSLLYDFKHEYYSNFHLLGITYNSFLTAKYKNEKSKIRIKKIILNDMLEE